MTRNGVFDCLCKFMQQDTPDDPTILVGLTGIRNLLTVAALMSMKQATNNKWLIRLKQRVVVKRIKNSKESQDSKVSELALEILNKYLRGRILKKKLKLKRAVICFRNERHSLFGLVQNKKKRLSV